MNKYFADFKLIYITVGITFVLLPVGLFVQGLIPAMAKFQVPQPILESPHYFDAMLWVYVHMMVIGVLIGLIGYSVTDFNKQKWITLLLFCITTIYTYLDFRSSDSILGNGLYKGDASIVPALISVCVNCMFLQLAMRMFFSSRTHGIKT